MIHKFEGGIVKYFLLQNYITNSSRSSAPNPAPATKGPPGLYFGSVKCTSPNGELHALGVRGHLGMRVGRSLEVFACGCTGLWIVVFFTALSMYCGGIEIPSTGPFSLPATDRLCSPKSLCWFSVPFSVMRSPCSLLLSFILLTDMTNSTSEPHTPLRSAVWRGFALSKWQTPSLAGTTFRIKLGAGVSFDICDVPLMQDRADFLRVMGRPIPVPREDDSPLAENVERIQHTSQS